MNGISREIGTRPLRVIQCFRAPIGGLFRHVCDLTRELAERGVEVGVLCDRGEADALSAARLEALACHTALGVHRRDMPRIPSPLDIRPMASLLRLASDYDADVLHGHGAKGGAYARVVAALSGRAALYTPHGGSLHYRPSTPSGFAFMSMERLLGRLGSPILFESAFSRDEYALKVGLPPPGSTVIPNGLAQHEFDRVVPAADAADILFIGEFRFLKGPDLLLAAMAELARRRPASAIFVGSGPEEARLRALAAESGLAAAVRFCDPRPAREAFALARVVVVPSRAESLPYVVLEAGAAGRPMVATDVGGIGEIFGPDSDLLIPPGDPHVLARALEAVLADPAAAEARALALREVIRSNFSLRGMVDGVLASYLALTSTVPEAAPAPLSRNRA